MALILRFLLYCPVTRATQGRIVEGGLLWRTVGLSHYNTNNRQPTTDNHLLEQSIEHGVDFVSDVAESFWIGLKFLSVAIDDDELARVSLDPFLVSIVETRQIVDAHGLLVFTSALADLRNEIRHGGADVDHEIRQLYKRHHRVEEVFVVVEIAVRHISLSVKVRRKDASILKDGAVLYYVLIALAYFHHFLESLVEEIYLQIE